MRFFKYFLLLVIIFTSSCTTSHPYLRSITQEDVRSFLEQTPQAQDHPNAGADLLFSYSYVELHDDGTSVNRNIHRMKIFNERGRNFATVSISYREGYQEVDVLFANTIKPDGQVVPLNKNDIYDTAEYAGYQFYTDIKVKKFTMPAVEDNCVIEYAYEIRNLKPILSLDYSETFFCRNLYPIEEDILEIVLPRSLELKMKNFNTDIVPEISTAGNRKKKYVFINRKQKEIIPESRMPSLWDKNTFPQISIWTLDRWETISQWYAKLVREKMTSDPELESFTQKLIEGKSTDEEKINAIFKFVSQNVRYIAVLLGPHTHVPHSATEIFRKRYGDCKDKTVLLLTMLKIAGIDAMPALVPSNGKYFDEGTPSLKVFNHIIAVATQKNRYLWLDATNETAAFDSPPFLFPTKVFLIKPDGAYQFIETPPIDDKKDYYVQDMQYTINTDGHATVNFTYRYFGKSAESARYYFKYSSPEQRKKFFEKVGIEVDRLDIGSFSETEEPFVIRLTGFFKNAAQVLDDETILLSGVVSYDTYKDITAATQRIYPVELKESFLSVEKIAYIFPPGFRIKRLPKDFEFKTPFKKLEEKYSFRHSTFTLETKEKNIDSTIDPKEIKNFQRAALELQKHESMVKNLIFIKRDQKLDIR
ncbi:MAG TPA: DUF3857 and transglutaminase domain-containing protein [Smithella sp.]|nr:DUF3857 and transglutaminase domain-containing protein [Smithella sp.]